MPSWWGWDNCHNHRRCHTDGEPSCRPWASANDDASIWPLSEQTPPPRQHTRHPQSLWGQEVCGAPCCASGPVSL